MPFDPSATALVITGPQNDFLSPELGDAYEAAVVNFGFIAGSVVTTDDAIDSMS